MAVDCAEDFLDENVKPKEDLNEGKIYKYIENILKIRKTLRELTEDHQNFQHS